MSSYVEHNMTSETTLGSNAEVPEIHILIKGKEQRHTDPNLKFQSMHNLITFYGYYLRY